MISAAVNTAAVSPPLGPVAVAVPAVPVPPGPRPTAALTIRSNSAADADLARPTTGGRAVRSFGGTTRVTCSPWTPRSSAASRCASPSSPATTMCGALGPL